MTMKKGMAIAGLVGALIGGVAVVADDALYSSPEFIALDADKDGLVSPEEATTLKRLADHFAATDTDGDGMVGAREFSAKATQE